MLQLVEIDEYWEKVLPWVEELDEYPPEVLRQQFKAEGWRLFWAEDGFFIGRLFLSPSPHLFVWLGAGNLKKYQGQMDQIAQEAGAAKILLRSSRKGFERRGYQLAGYIFERSLPWA